MLMYGLRPPALHAVADAPTSIFPSPQQMSSPNISEAWQKTLKRRLSQFGHRNWIVIADSAYPIQTSPGIEMVLSGSPLAATTQRVLSEIASSRHVRPIVHLDSELASVSPRHAPGIASVRHSVARFTKGLPVRHLPHNDIIARVSAAGREFHILVIKTREILPYTSVFIELDCGYWSSAAESDLRKAIAGDRSR